MSAPDAPPATGWTASTGADPNAAACAARTVSCRSAGTAAKGLTIRPTYRMGPYPLADLSRTDPDRRDRRHPRQGHSSRLDSARSSWGSGNISERRTKAERLLDQAEAAPDFERGEVICTQPQCVHRSLK